MPDKLIFTILLILPLLLQACAPVVVGGAAVGVSVLHDRRPAEVVLTDEKSELGILAAIGEDENLYQHSSVGVTSYNRVVLLTGQADSPAVSGRIRDIAAGNSGVRRVVNEIQITTDSSLMSTGHDIYLTSRVKLALFDLDLPDFDPSRVKVVTEQNVVYLMGLLTPDEAAAVVEKVRYVNGVKRVVKILEYI
jgi:osmotically-inducible protein OsmY